MKCNDTEDIEINELNQRTQGTNDKRGLRGRKSGFYPELYASILNWIFAVGYIGVILGTLCNCLLPNLVTSVQAE